VVGTDDSVSGTTVDLDLPDPTMAAVSVSSNKTMKRKKCLDAFACGTVFHLRH
jgi:hypothetical protein